MFFFLSPWSLLLQTEIDRYWQKNKFIVYTFSKFLNMYGFFTCVANSFLWWIWSMGISRCRCTRPTLKKSHHHTICCTTDTPRGSTVCCRTYCTQLCATQADVGRHLMHCLCFQRTVTPMQLTPVQGLTLHIVPAVEWGGSGVLCSPQHEIFRQTSQVADQQTIADQGNFIPQHTPAESGPLSSPTKT